MPWWLALLHGCWAASMQSVENEADDISPEQPYPTHSEAQRITLSTFFSPPTARVSEDRRPPGNKPDKPVIPEALEEEPLTMPQETNFIAEKLEKLTLGSSQEDPEAVLVQAGKIAVSTPRSIDEFQVACDRASELKPSPDLMLVWLEQVNRIVLLTSIFGHQHLEHFLRKTKHLLLNPEWHNSFLTGLSQQRGIVFNNGMRAWLSAFPEKLPLINELAQTTWLTHVEAQERRIFFRLIGVYEAMINPQLSDGILAKIDRRILVQQPTNAIIIVLYFGDITGSFRRYLAGDATMAAVLKAISGLLATPPHTAILILKTILALESKTLQPIHFAVFLRLFTVDPRESLPALAKYFSPMPLCTFLQWHQQQLDKSFVIATLSPWLIPRMSAEAYYEIVELPKSGLLSWLPSMRTALSMQPPRLLLGIAFIFLHVVIGMPIERLMASCRESIDIHNFVHLINTLAEREGSNVRLASLSLTQALELTKQETLKWFWEAFEPGAVDVWSTTLEEALPLIDGDEERALCLAIQNRLFVIFSRMLMLQPDPRSIVTKLFPLAVENEREVFCLFMLYHWGDSELLSKCKPSASFHRSLLHLMPTYEPRQFPIREELNDLESSIEHLAFDEGMNLLLWTSLPFRHQELGCDCHRHDGRLEEMAQLIFRGHLGKTPWQLIPAFDATGSYGCIGLLLLHLLRTGQYHELDHRVDIASLSPLTRSLISRHDVEERLIFEDELGLLLDSIWDRRQTPHRPQLFSDKLVVRRVRIDDVARKGMFTPVQIAYYTFQRPLLDWLMVMPAEWPSDSLIDSLNYLLSRLAAFYGKRLCVRFVAK